MTLFTLDIPDQPQFAGMGSKLDAKPSGPNVQTLFFNDIESQIHLLLSPTMTAFHRWLNALLSRFTIIDKEFPNTKFADFGQIYGVPTIYVHTFAS